MLRVHTLQTWLPNDWAQGMYSRGIKCIRSCAVKYVFEKEHVTDIPELFDAQTENQLTPTTPKTPSCIVPLNKQTSFSAFFPAITQPDTVPRIAREIQLETFEKELDKEISIFSSRISKNNCALIFEMKSTGSFWRERGADGKLIFPILSKLALKFISVPSSSAAIERLRWRFKETPIKHGR